MLRRPQCVEYFLTHEGEWLLSAERAVAIARIDFDLKLEIRAATESAERYLEKLLAAHPFTDPVKRWVIYRGDSAIALVLARNRYEAARLSGAPPQEIKVVAEEELDPQLFQGL
jgi:hypothetical protein